MQTKLVGAFAVIATLFLALVAPAQAADPFRIGAVLPITGAYSQYGDFTRLGLTVAVKEINDRGGILGRKVELVIRDDASNPGRSLLAAKELLTEQKVDFLYPEIISGLILATLPYATENKVITISNGASPQIGDVSKFPYSFQFADLATKRLPAMAAAMKKLGGTKVGILVSTNPPQVALGDALNADLPTKYGMAVAGYKQFTVDAKDLSARDNVRVVMEGLQTLGWKAKLVTEPAALYGDLTDQIPAAVAGQFFAVNYRIGTRSGPPLPAVKAFIDDMKAIAPISNLSLSAIARDAMFLVKWSFETAQAEKGNTSPESLKATLESISTRKLPDGYAIVLANPGYTPTDHTTAGVGFRVFV